MLIDISELRQERGAAATFTFREEMSHLDFGGEEIPFAAPVEVTGQAVNTGYAFLVKGTVHTALSSVCSLCLTSFELPLQAEFAALYREADAVPEEDAEEEFFDVYPLSGDIIDLTRVVLESIVLAVPMKPICREDCRGLCQRCGQNRNTGSCDCSEEKGDPRFAVLQQLLHKEN